MGKNNKTVYLFGLFVIALISFVNLYSYKVVCKKSDDIYAKMSYLRRQNEVNLERIQGENASLNNLKDRLDVVSRRTWLLSVVNNNNVHALEHKQGKLIMFDKDWKIPDPSNVELSAEGKKQIKRYILYSE